MPSTSVQIPERRLRHLTTSCLAIAVLAAAAAALTSRTDDWEPLSLLAVLATFNLASELLAYRHEGPGFSSWSVISSAPVVLAMALLGPAPALAVAAIGLIVDARRDRTSLVDLAANLANYGTFVVVGGLLARWAIESWSLVPGDAGFALLIVTLTVFVDGSSYLMNATHGWLAYGDPLRAQWKREGERIVGAEVPIALFTAVTSVFYGTVGLGALGLLAVVQLVHQYLAGGLLVSQQRAEALEAQAERMTELSASRGRLVGQVLQAEEIERRRLAEALHDEALQELLAARQGLAPVGDARAERARGSVNRAIDQLRGAIFDLHPAVLEHAGLAAALNEVADLQAERAGFRAEVDVDPSVCGDHDSLLFVLGREQLVNAAKHSGATDVGLLLSRDNGRIVMEVSDNGCGMGPESRRTALRQGHVGLASTAERIDALGGTFEIDSEPGRGTVIRTVLPTADV